MHHALSRERWRVDRMRGALGPLQAPDEIAARGFSDEEMRTVETTRRKALVGTAAQVGAQAACARRRRWAWTNWWSTPGPTTRRCGVTPMRCWRGSSALLAAD